MQAFVILQRTLRYEGAVGGNEDNGLLNVELCVLHQLLQPRDCEKVEQKRHTTSELHCCFVLDFLREPEWLSYTLIMNSIPQCRSYPRVIFTSYHFKEN